MLWIQSYLCPSHFLTTLIKKVWLINEWNKNYYEKRIQKLFSKQEPRNHIAGFCLSVSILRPVIGRDGSVWLYCFALIGQNQGTLRPPADLSRVRHPQVCPCTSVHYRGWTKQLHHCSKQSFCSKSLNENIRVSHLKVWESTSIKRLE